MTSNQAEPGTQQMMYQQQAYAGYPASATSNIGTWGQAQAQPQGMPFAISYHGDVNSYADKAGYGGAYPPLQYNGGGDSEFYRQNSFAPSVQYNQTQQTAQWTQPAYQQAFSSTQQQTGYSSYGAVDRDSSRGATFNPGAPPPNMNRPPPNMKRENANLSMLNQESAAYTASWVSSTSSIPPELKDEPEFGTLGREDQSNNVFNATNYADQFSNMNLHDNQKGQRVEMADWSKEGKTGTGLQSQQWPGLGQQQIDESNRLKKQERDRRPRDDARELTWDERLRKAQVQKERVEQRERGAGGERDARDRDMSERGRGTGRGRGPSRGGIRSGGEGRDNRGGSNEGANGETQFQQNGSGDVVQQGRNNFRGRGMGSRGGMAPAMGVAMPMFPGQSPMMMPPRGMPFMRGGPPPPPPHMMNMQQDERFKNTWLDANAFMQPFALPFPPVPFGMDNRCGGRGRGRGGFRGGMSRGGGYVKKEHKKDVDKKEEKDEADCPTPNSGEVESSAAASPEISSEVEAEEKKEEEQA